MHFAREGADVAIVYLKQEEKDAQETESLVKAEGRRCLLFVGDVGEAKTCDDIVAKTVDALGGLHVLVNNAGEQHFCECTEGWFGPQCQCGEQPYECTESNHCHWCGPLTLCLMSKEECEAGESALHGQVNRGAACAPTRRVMHCIAPSGAPQPGHAAAPVSRALRSIAAGGRALTRAAGWKRRLRRCRSGRACRRKTPRYPR